MKLKKIIAAISAVVLGVSIVASNVQFESKAATSVSLSWNYITYGNGAKTTNASYTGSISGTSGSVQLTSGKLTNGVFTGENSSGKLVPASYDGLSFYYSKVPTNVNFTFRAKVSVNQWWLSNGQEGMGVMVADKVGGKGWNNCYMVCASTNTYKWNGTEVDNTNGKSITQKLGIVTYAKSGVTTSNISEMESGNTEIIQRDFVAEMYPMDQRYPQSVNVVGNGVNCPAGIEKPITEFYVTIQKNNTGYFITYETTDGSYKLTKKYYDTEVLSKLDKDYVYIGFFTSRYAQATFSDVSFTSVDPANDAQAETQPVEKIPVKFSNQSLKYSGNENFTVRFKPNCDGKITVKTGSGTVLAKDVDMKANLAMDVVSTTLNIGDNRFIAEFTPDKDYVPGKNQEMQSYETVTSNWNTVRKVIGDEKGNIYVAPDGSGDGTYNSPMNLTEVIRYVSAGQTIVLKEGNYNVTSTVTVAKGINGTADKMIRMVADPNAKTRPVFDANKTCTVMQITGDYWYCSGFDITNSSNGSTGLRLSGNHCVLDNVNAYHNGNTGIAIGSADSSEGFDKWPSYNLVVNCTSYGNADLGYEDADGFAAKITNGVGNVFDNCIAYNNADDGWDLFAKVQTGSIGAVTIRNCVAYGNGYLEDGTNAGNGNGFKLGGDSLSGHHILENSVSFNNKANGIDANSCPDIIVRNCTSYNNGGGNISLSSGAANTDFDIKGYISFRDSSWNEKMSNSENIGLKGSQDKTKVYGADNYYWNTSSKAGVNNSGASTSSKWFESLDTKFDVNTHTFTERVVTRNADNSINMNGLLVLTDAAPVDAGGRIEAWANPEINGLKLINGIWGYYEKGRILADYTGLVPYAGNMWQVTCGYLDKTVSGYIDYMGKTYRVLNGKADLSVNGLTYTDGTWAYCKAGVVQTDYTGLVYYNSDWWYVTDGYLDKAFKGVTSMNGKLWFIRNGKISRENGITEYNGNIYWISNGAVDTSVTDLKFNGNDGKWYYFRQGVVDWTYNTLAYANKQWWYINNGVLDKSYTGLVPFRNQLWYVTQGKLDKSYVGTVSYNGDEYMVSNGVGKKK